MSLVWEASMVGKVAPIYAKYHNANISKEVIESAVKPSDKTYTTGNYQTKL